MSNYFNGCCITREMVQHAAENHDECCMGTIVLVALGIRGECTGFCKCKNSIYGSTGKHYNVFWTKDGYDCYMETFHEDKIMNALERVKITVEKKF